MSKYFGTDGFRGEANKALNVEHAYKIGRFLGAYYGREHKCSVVIGKDTRRSGYMFECALTAGLTASGADAYLMHVTTTPSVSYITRTDDFDCGIMISASHNPYFDNGIKLPATSTYLTSWDGRHRHRPDTGRIYRPTDFVRHGLLLRSLPDGGFHLLFQPESRTLIIIRTN